MSAYAGMGIDQPPGDPSGGGSRKNPLRALLKIANEAIVEMESKSALPEDAPCDYEDQWASRMCAFGAVLRDCVNGDREARDLVKDILDQAGPGSSLNSAIESRFADHCSCESEEGFGETQESDGDSEEGDV